MQLRYHYVATIPQVGMLHVLTKMASWTERNSRHGTPSLQKKIAGLVTKQIAYRSCVSEADTFAASNVEMSTTTHTRDVITVLAEYTSKMTLLRLRHIHREFKIMSHRALSLLLPRLHSCVAPDIAWLCGRDLFRFTTLSRT